MRRFALTDEARDKICEDLDATEAEVRKAEAKIEDKLYFVANDDGTFHGYLLLQIHVPVLLSMDQVEVLDA